MNSAQREMKKVVRAFEALPFIHPKHHDLGVLPRYCKVVGGFIYSEMGDRPKTVSVYLRTSQNGKTHWSDTVQFEASMNMVNYLIKMRAALDKVDELSKLFDESEDGKW